ncbi:hypothetical protein [Ornithinimicrobium pratense]|uniref:Uncharacterized protein n=1 Tax=Ornithinimicrobium pratense TaxID=2593973 RepID=A0A5J6V8S1_9MICO|nr:hypothetical protein [Ornithinimicrobium pratense]QFG69501.1 hypothetical protein FY030_13015 [Ornithinimicrobium pratense]
MTGQEENVLGMGTWMTLLGYTEFYADGILSALFEKASREVDVGIQYLLKKEANKAYNTWLARKEALAGVFGVRITELSSWARLDAAIWVRNGIAHGSGGLTRMQKAQEAGKAILVGVPLNEGRLVLSAMSVATCADVCCEFVEELDLATRKELSQS